MKQGKAKKEKSNKISIMKKSPSPESPFRTRIWNNFTVWTLYLKNVPPLYSELKFDEKFGMDARKHKTGVPSFGLL